MAPLFATLAAYKHTTMTAVAAAELLAVVLRSREAIVAVLDNKTQLSTLCGHLNIAVDALDMAGGRAVTNKTLRFAHAVILCLLHVAYIRPGRQALLSVDVLSLVHPLAKKLVPMCKTTSSTTAGHAQRVLLMVSILIQRCLPPLPLPLDNSYVDNLLSNVITLLQHFL